MANFLTADAFSGIFCFILIFSRCSVRGGLWTKDLSPLQFLCKKSSPEKTVHYSRIRTQTVGIEGEHAVHSNGLNCVTCTFFKKMGFFVNFRLFKQTLWYNK